MQRGHCADDTASARMCVLSNMFINYCEGDRNAAVAPDLFVAFGVSPPHDWRSYKLWEQPLPAWVMEVLSAGDGEAGAGREVPGLRVAGGEGVLAARPVEALDTGGATGVSAVVEEGPERR